MTLYKRRSADNSIVGYDSVSYRVTIIPPENFTGTIRPYIRLNGGAWSGFSNVAWTNGVTTQTWPYFLQTRSWAGNTAADVTQNFEFKCEITAGPGVGTNQVQSHPTLSIRDVGNSNPLLPALVSNHDMVFDFRADTCPDRDLTFSADIVFKIRTEVTVALIVDGTVRKTWLQQPPFYGGTSSGSFSFGPVHTDGAFSYSWTVNGETVWSNSYQCADEIPGSSLHVSTDYDQPSSPSDPGDPPVPGVDEPAPEPGPYVPTPGAPSPPTAPGSNSGYNASGGVGTQGDMYAAVRKAVEDGIAASEQHSSSMPHRLPERLDALDKRGKLDEIQGQLDTIDGQMRSAKAIGDKVQSGKEWIDQTLPTSLGTVNSVSLGSINMIDGYSLDLEIDLTWPGFPLIRAVLLFFLAVGFVVLCISTFSEYL